MQPKAPASPLPVRSRTLSPLPLCVLTVAAALAVQAYLLPRLGAEWSAAGLLVQFACALVAGGVLHLLLRSAPAAAPVRAVQPAAPYSIGLDEYRRQLRSLAEALPIGVLVASGDRVHWTNMAMRRQLGWPEAGMDGQPTAALFADPAEAEPVLRTSGPCDAAVRLLRADGSCFRGQVNAGSVTLGRLQARLLLVNDLTDSEDTASRLVQQREELQAMARHLITLQEEERTALSRELHDDVGQAITAIKLCALALVDENEARRLVTVQEIAEIADQTVVKLRNLALLLRPPQLDALGLEAALRSQADAMFRSRHIQLTLALTPLVNRPAPAVELACFRIAQEALTNALRHSGATRVVLSLAAVDGETLELSVDDNGGGFEPTRLQGLGMVTMRERAQQLGGTLQVGPGASGGTCIRVRLPMRCAR